MKKGQIRNTARVLAEILNRDGIKARPERVFLTKIADIRFYYALRRVIVEDETLPTWESVILYYGPAGSGIWGSYSVNELLS